MRIKWLHLSDIHFNYKNYDSDLLRKDFIERIAELSKGESFTHLFLSGDILYRNGTPDSKTISLYYRVVVFSDPLQGHVLHCKGCCGLVVLPTARRFKKGSDHSPLQNC